MSRRVENFMSFKFSYRDAVTVLDTIFSKSTQTNIRAIFIKQKKEPHQLLFNFILIEFYLFVGIKLFTNLKMLK